MIDTKTIEGLYALRLPAMAAALADQEDQAAYAALSFEQRLGLLVDKELTEREDRRVGRYLKAARLRTTAVVEDIDFRRQRGLDRSMVLGLAGANWVKAHNNLAIVGPTGAGKTFMACALANAAVRHGHTAFYLRPTHARRTGHRPCRRAFRAPFGLLGAHRRPGHRLIPRPGLSRCAVGVEARRARSWWASRRPGQRADRDNHRLSRKAMRLSVGRYRPGGDEGVVIRARARSLIVMSACR